MSNSLTPKVGPDAEGLILVFNNGSLCAEVFIGTEIFRDPNEPELGLWRTSTIIRDFELDNDCWSCRTAVRFPPIASVKDRNVTEGAEFGEESGFKGNGDEPKDRAEMIELGRPQSTRYF